MNKIYIIFIAIVSISFILGLFVTFFKAQYKMKLQKYNNNALQKDNYEYAKDYIYDTNTYNFHDKLEDLDNEISYSNNINKNVNENTIIIPILDEDEENINKMIKPKIYSIVDDEII